MTAHTPGPWEIDDLFNDTHIMAMRNGAPCNVVTGMYDEENEPSLEELRANARLIKASPALLKALKDLTENAKYMVRELLCRPKPSLIDAADKAIEEAEQP